MCKRVLSRGSERTLAGRTRGCGGLFKEEIQEVGGPEDKSESQYRGWRVEISSEKLGCMRGLINRIRWEKTRSQNKGDDSQFLCPFQLGGVKGALSKLSSSKAVFTPGNKHMLTMVHVTDNGHVY